MKIGMAAVELTPPANVPLEGFEVRKTGSRGIHDPLFAKALVVDDGKNRVAWLIADLIGIPAEVTAQVRAAVSPRIKVPPDHIMLSATHTHGGPGVRPAPAIEADHAAHAKWLAAFPGKLQQAFEAAAARLEPMEVSFGRGICSTMQHNRRFHMKDGTVKMVWDNPKPEDVAWLGPVDPGVQVLAFKSGGRLRGVLVQFACHATAVTGDNYHITADWPGVTGREIKAATGTPDLWMAVAQGCCGNITPAPPRGTFELCEVKGKQVAEVVMQALGRVEPVRGETVAAVRIPVSLPRKKPGLDPAPTGEFRESEVQALRLGDIAVVGLPGECFVEMGLEIKAHSPFRGTFVGSYSADYDDAGLGYIPVAWEYNGGYEVTASGVGPGAHAILFAAAREALGRVGGT